MKERSLRLTQKSKKPNALVKHAPQSSRKTGSGTKVVRSSSKTAISELPIYSKSVPVFESSSMEETRFVRIVWVIVYCCIAAIATYASLFVNTPVEAVVLALMTWVAAWFSYANRLDNEANPPRFKRSVPKRWRWRTSVL